MRVAGYVRVSKADRNKTEEDQRQSLRAQCDSISRYCEERGWTLVDCFEDFAISGSTEERPGYQAALALVSSGGADRLAVTRLDRLSRETAVLLRLLDEVHPIVTDQHVDASTASGWLAAGMLSLIAEHERRQTSERTRAVLAQRKREGKQVGRASTIPPDVHGRIVALSETMSASAIARLFNEEGLSKGNEGQVGASPVWDHSHITSALRRMA